MPTSVGPNILGEGNLVFGYDLSDQKNSYVGEPTTNVFTSYGTVGYGAASDNNVGFPVQGGYGLIRLGYGQTFGNYTIKPSDVVYKYNLGSYGCHYHGLVTSIPQGVYLTFSFEYYLSPGLIIETSYLANVENYGNGALSGGLAVPNTATGVWHRASFTVGPTTSSGTQAMFIYPGGCGGRLSASGYVLYKNPQVEFKSYQTPFVNGTRSNTQGLLDLTGNSTINVSGVSFNNNSQITFDGTNDEIAIPYNSSFNTNTFTVEAVCKLTTNDNQHRTVASRNASVYSHSNGWWMGTLRNGLGNGNNDFRFFMWGDSGYITYNTSNGGNDNNFHHMVLSCDGLTGFFYVDGVLVYSATKPSGNLYSPSSDLLVGRSPSGDYWSGDIPQVKFYNRRLTTAEIQNNYNIIKRKYGI